MTETNEIHVAVMVGSLRKGSYNQALYRAALELAPNTMRLRQVSIGDLPFYSPDIDQPGEAPLSAETFRAELRSADTLLIITPEYNHSLPGVVKNALDWASRPYADAPIHNTPAAVMGVSGSPTGAARSQLHLRAIAGALRLHLLASPNVMVGNAAEKFDQSGNLTDQATRDQVQSLLVALEAWTRRLG